MSEEARDEQAWQDLLAQLEKYHPEELAAIDRVAAEKERVRHPPISAENLRRYPRPWHENDKILRTLRLNNLWRKGYIDLPSTLGDDAKKIDDDFDIPVARSLPDPDVGDAHSRTNPVLRQDCWYPRRITPQDYSAIKPALTLASCLLSEPTVLTFYTGLLEGVRTLDRPDVIEKYNNDPANERKLDRLFRFSAQLGPYDHETLERTFKKLCAMGPYVGWGFGRLDSAQDAETEAGPNDGFVEDTTSDSTITLSEDFLIGIRYVSELEKRGYPVKVKVNEFWYKHTGTGFDQASADMRRQFYLAVTILHELTHAVWKSVHERFPNVTSSTDLGFEPFHGDQHLNELGYALEQAIFGGRIVRPGLTPAISPYGLQICDFPGLDRASYLGDMCFALGSAKEYGIEYGRRSPIKAIDYLRFFKRRFWAKDVPKSGGSELMVPRRVSIRVVAREDIDDFDSDDEAVQSQALTQPWTSHDVLVERGWRDMRPQAYNRPRARQRQDQPHDGAPPPKRQRQ